jgi:SAM-dependent methyltransferase
MIRALQRRATKAKLAGRIEARICSENSLGIDDLRGQIDFVLAFAVVHEIPDSRRLFTEIFEVLKEDRLMLFSEPKGHVSSEEFAQSELAAFAAGFNRVTTVHIPKSHSTILKK